MKTTIDTREFEVKAGKKVRLKHWPTRVRPFYKSKEDYEEILKEHIDQLSRSQSLLYAHNRYAILLVFQAMDAAGKDGVIKHVMSGLNPQGCQVFSFKQPSSEELDHDFLWRTNVRLPERGRLGIFNRSYYEEVLVVRVHPDLLEKENLPEDLGRGKDLWKGRYRSIREMEQHLYRNGTRVLKFFLHLSKEEQRQRFLKRIEDPEKNWKFSLSDVEERKLWKDYTKAYEDCLSETHSKEAPWYIVPADDKPNARLLISEIILKHLRGLKLRYPEPGKQQQHELKRIRKALSS